MDNDDRKKLSPRKNILMRIGIIAAIVLGILFFGGVNAKNTQNRITIDEFARMLRDKNNVTNVTISTNKITITAKENEREHIYSITSFKEPSMEKVMASLERLGVEKSSFASIRWKEEYTFSDYIGKYSSYIFFGFLFLLLILWVRKNSGSMNMFQMKTRQFIKEERSQITFNDVAGVEEAKSDVRDIVAFLKSPSRFILMGARMPKGILFIGEPGTGKTLLAKAVAGEAGVPFFIISGSDFVEMFVGLGASRVRALFAEAKKKAPCIIFIDEIDALGGKRGASNLGGHNEYDQTLNALLAEMDGFSSNTNIVVIGATNRPDVLDPALLRPGRFDTKTILHMPLLKDREAILRVHTRGKNLGPDINLLAVAKKTFHFSGADLENIMNKAAIIAAKDLNAEYISQKHLELAVDNMLLGSERKSITIPYEEKKRTTYHEAGHTIVAYHLESKTKSPVERVAITPRGIAGGYTLIVPEEDMLNQSKEKLEAHIAIGYGSLVAEKMIFKNSGHGQGVANDLQRIDEIAWNMVTQWGMGDIDGHLILFPANSRGIFSEQGSYREYSQKELAFIHDSVKQIKEKCYHIAEAILEKNKDALDALSEELLQKEVMERDEFLPIIEHKK